MLTRREFIGGSLGALVAARAVALPTDKFRWSISSHQFTPLKPHPETGIKMTARFGLHGIEPWANEMQHYLSQPPEVFKKVLDESGIGISSIHSGGEYFDRKRLPATIETNAAHARYAAAFGVKALKANLSRRLGPEDLSLANAKILAQNLNDVGRRTLEHGVKFAFHPHDGSIIDRRTELDMILELTDPNLVFVTLDTCHASLGGIDPVKFLRDYYPRMAHMHYKDTLPVWSSIKGWSGPPPSKEERTKHGNIYQRLGVGAVDFPAITRLLRERNFDGWISLDFNAVDMPEGVTIEEDMAAHRKYLLETLHATLTR
jgi:inosose dehydratase